MKTKFLIWGGILFLGLMSCKKESNENCIVSVVDSPERMVVSEVDNNASKTLFTNNKIAYNNFQVYSYVPNNSLDHTAIICEQYVNGFKVFSNPLVFYFSLSGVYESRVGEIITKIALDTKPRMSQQEVVDVYKTAILKDEAISSIKGENLACCTTVEFGYYNLNQRTNDTTKNFVKSWKVLPQGKEFPEAYINDTNGTIIWYFNGIITE